MASTYSSLKIQLMATGENSGTWGNVTNVNLGTALEEAIVGSADVTFSSGTVTLTLTDTNASQTARNLRLNLTGTSGGAQNLIVPAIEKVYIVNNDCADAITVKNSTGTGIAVPAGKTMYLYNNGTNVVEAINHLTSLTLDTPLPVSSGGTGSNTGINASTSVTGILPVANGGTGVNTSTGTGSVVLSASPTFTGTPLSTTAANGTNTTQIATTAFVGAAVTNATGSLGTMSTQNANSVSITGGSITGITDLAVADGGTGASTLAANNVLLGNGTSALQTVAPGSSGNILTSNGTTWQSTAPAAGGVTSLNGQTGAITDTTFSVIGSYMIGGVTNGGSTTNSPGGTVAGSTVGRKSGSSIDATVGFGTWQSYSLYGATGTWRFMGGSTNGAVCGEVDGYYAAANLLVRIS
jgi:hypothetical protein